MIVARGVTEGVMVNGVRHNSENNNECTVHVSDEKTTTT
jgi:hypothetical protein